jgi:hypothetical protein
MEQQKDHNPAPARTALVEGLDYYVENGYWVLTEHFLRKRGDCCGSGCRHCPYQHKNVERRNRSRR